MFKPQANDEYSADDKAREEGTKLFFDTIKHLTTLSTGSILLLVALLEKLFNVPHWKPLVALSFLCFIVCTIVSMRLMVFLSAHIASRTPDTSGGIWFYRISVYSFIIGIVSLVIFVLRNLWR